MMQLSRSSRKKAEWNGRFAEFLAVWYLRLQFYRIRAVRLKTPVGELDIVAARGRQTVFVEVKMRKNRDAEEMALRAVNRSRIVRAAQFYLTQHPHLTNHALRFDVIFLAPFAWPRHVKGAFETTE